MHHVTSAADLLNEFYILDYLTRYEGPALQRLHHEIYLGRQRIVAVRLAGFRTAQVEVPIQPQPELAVARPDADTLVVALDEIQVLARPVVHLEVGREGE